MAEVSFYHLTQAPLDQALPKLLHMIYQRGLRTLVHGPAEAALARLDAQLWAFSETVFLPHACAKDAPEDAQQPLLLSKSRQNANEAEVLVLIDGARIDLQEVPKYTRVCLLFEDGQSTHLQEAREDWAALAQANVLATYWAQSEAGWVKKASRQPTGG